MAMSESEIRRKHDSGTRKQVKVVANKWQQRPDAIYVSPSLGACLYRGMGWADIAIHILQDELLVVSPSRRLGQ